MNNIFSPCMVKNPDGGGSRNFFIKGAQTCAYRFTANNFQPFYSSLLLIILVN